MLSKEIHLDITIKGKVQGVFFRATAERMATELGIRGLVRNLDNGDVYSEAEGDRIQVEKFVEWCHHGPASARVDQVIVEEGDIKGYHSFKQLREKH